jgi:hypothetical protein
LASLAARQEAPAKVSATYLLENDFVSEDAAGSDAGSAFIPPSDKALRMSVTLTGSVIEDAREANSGQVCLAFWSDDAATGELKLKNIVMKVRSSSEASGALPNWISQVMTRRYKGPAKLGATVNLASGASLFVVDPRTGQITLGTINLDFETKRSFSVDVFMIDNGSPPLSTTTGISIKVLDVNEPPVLKEVTVYIEENKPKFTPVSARIEAGDPDEGEVLEFKFIGHKEEVFVIEACNGQITVNKPVIDYESTKAYYMTVTVTDSGDLSDTGAVTIEVIDVNEAPEIGPLSVSLVENTRIGTLVGSPVSSKTVDPDEGHLNTMEYAISEGDPGGVFSIDAKSGQLSVTKEVDYESRPQYTQKDDNPTMVCRSSTEPPAAKLANGNLRIHVGSDYREPDGSELQCVAGVKRTANQGSTTAVSTCPSGYGNMGMKLFSMQGYESTADVQSYNCAENEGGCFAKCPPSASGGASCSVETLCCKSKAGNKPQCRAGERQTTPRDGEWSAPSRCPRGTTVTGVAAFNSI